MSPSPHWPSPRKLWQLSRPRFWIYVFGPYIVGLAAGATRLTDFQRWPVIVCGLFFLFPANLLIYGVNDIFDYETDKHNAKKTDYETFVSPVERSGLWWAIALANLPFLLALRATNAQASGALVAFLFFSLFYSMPPMRAKTKPILDSAFNVLYICPGIFAYYLIGGHALAIPLVLAAWCWAMAMHAYSAVPDITADSAAGLQTVATFLGLRGTLIFCLLLYTTAAMLAVSVLSFLAVILGTVYIGLMLASLHAGTEQGVMRLYRGFPLINTISGAVLFFAAAWPKFGL